MAGFTKKPPVRGSAWGNKLIAKNIPSPEGYVKYIYCYRSPKRRDFATPKRFMDEALSAGLLEVVECSRRWRRRGGASFPHYAYKCIRWKMKAAGFKGIERERRLPVCQDTDISSLTHEDSIEESLDRQTLVEAALGAMTKRERGAVRAYYNLDGDGGRTLEQIGWILDVGREQVRQIILHGLVRARWWIRRMR